MRSRLSPKVATPRRASLLAVLLVATPAAPVQERTPSLAERTGFFRSPRVAESSGVAVSRRYPGVLWTHNDSGNEAVVYATNLAGEDLGRYTVPGAKNDDWEDVALAPCPGQTHPCWYLADTGDNNEHRKHAGLYLVPEPDQPPTPAGDRAPARVAPRGRHVVIRYPDRPRDVEALWVNPDGSVELVTKGTSGPILRYLIPAAGLTGNAVTPDLVDTLPIVPRRAIGRLVTGAAISPSGNRVVIRTYTELYFFHRQDDRHLSPEGGPCWLGALQPQGEGVAFLDEDTLVLTSEGALGRPGPIHRVRC